MSKTILLSALNWGIGHATRDMPIINRLLDKGHKVILASDGAALAVWKREYPELTHVEMPSWNIKYQKRGSFILKMATRAPYILKAIWKERSMVRELVKKYNIDGIISDNRFGVWHKEKPTVFLTHQIDMKLSKYLTWAEPFLYLFNRSQIKKYDEVWVPDFEGKVNLSGSLSHNHRPIKNIKFIQPVSRFMDSWDGTMPEQKYDVAAVISGVEPQRQMFEDKLIEQFMDLTDLRVILVQGKSDRDETKELRPGFTIKSYMATEEMMQTFLASKHIICRSGYSTILDLAVLKQSALMVPTPGQTEQVYLGRWLTRKKLIVAQSQKKFDVRSGLEELKKVQGFDLQIDDSSLNAAIDDFLARC